MAKGDRDDSALAPVLPPPRLPLLSPLVASWLVLVKGLTGEEKEGARWNVSRAASSVRESWYWWRAGIHESFSECLLVAWGVI